MVVHRIINSIFASNTYILEEQNIANHAFLVDVGDMQAILDFLKKRNLVVIGVFLTHTYYDHIYGIRNLLKCFPKCIVYTSSFGENALGSDKLNFSRYHHDSIRLTGDNIRVLHDGESTELFPGKFMEALETPGHDKSCLTFKLEKNVFSGDSYIPGLKVIASFPNSHKMEAEYSKKRIISIFEGCNLYPGHGDVFINI